MIDLIINADDFGMSTIYNKSILDLCINQNITSTSVMITRISNAQQNQIEQLIRFSNSSLISIGLHLTFSDTDYLNQTTNQFKIFKKYFKQNPSHIDIHKYFKQVDSYAIVDEFCFKMKIPTRNHGISHKANTTDLPVYFGTYKSQNEIEAWLQSLTNNKCYEILFHPGKYDNSVTSTLNFERENDIQNILQLNKYLKNMKCNKITYNDLNSHKIL
jgi:predicted glycoside hydrolase/deacetylase ChbG (UPF0249 family)